MGIQKENPALFFFWGGGSFQHFRSCWILSFVHSSKRTGTKPALVLFVWVVIQWESKRKTLPVVLLFGGDPILRHTLSGAVLRCPAQFNLC